MVWLVVGGPAPAGATVAGNAGSAVSYAKGHGYRSSIGASLLKRAGFTQVMNVIGGFDAWQTCGLPCAHPDNQPA